MLMHMHVYLPPFFLFLYRAYDYLGEPMTYPEVHYVRVTLVGGCVVSNVDKDPVITKRHTSPKSYGISHVPVALLNQQNLGIMRHFGAASEVRVESWQGLLPTK